MTRVRDMISALRHALPVTSRREYEGVFRDLWKERETPGVRGQLRYTLARLRELDHETTQTRTIPDDEHAHEHRVR